MEDSTSAKRPGNATVQKTRRKLYKWHRILGIMTVVPVIFWVCSGLTHPLMAYYFKVAIAHEYIMPEPLNKAQINLSLKEVLNKNGIKSLSNFRLVKIKDSTYYQVKNPKNDLVYFSSSDAKVLVNGEKVYAAYLARYFLGDSTSKVKSIDKITDFTDEYKYVNRLLPVWRVSFDRGDHMDVYVETAQSRLANYNDTPRKVFLWIFSNFHSYEFLAKLTNNTFRYTVLLLLASIVIGSTLSGILVYIFMWKYFKKPKAGQKLSFLRRNHRVIGIWTSLITLLFIGSGAYHATTKFKPDDRIKYVFEPEISTADLITDSRDLPVNWNLVSNLSLAKIGDSTYFQVFKLNKKDDSWKQQQVDKAEKMAADQQHKIKPELDYYNASNGALLQDGAMEHSYSLVKHFVVQGAADGEPACCEMMANAQADRSAPLDIVSYDYLRNFDREYSFVNKRLPVVKIELNTPQHIAYYVEPSTGRMAARIDDSNRTEGLSFAVFHKFLWAGFAGKNIRDLINVIAALAVLTVSLLGLMVFIKTK